MSSSGLYLPGLRIPTELELPSGEITEMVPPGERTIAELDKWVRTQWERLCPLAQSIGAVAVVDYITKYFKLTYQRFSGPTPFMYEVPITYILSKRSEDFIRNSAKSVPGNFFETHKYDYTNYTFELELITENTDKYNVNPSNPNVVRLCNIAMGAYIASQKLEELGYTRREISPTKWVYDPPVTAVEEEEEVEDIENIDIKNLATFYTENVTGKSGLYESYHSPYMEIITLDQLREIVNDDLSMRQIQVNLINYLKWKKEEYIERLNGLEIDIAHEKEIFRRADLSEKELESLSTAKFAKLAKAYLTGALECIDTRIVELGKMPLYDLRTNYMNAIELISQINVEQIQEQISMIIASLARGYQGFSTGFQNIVITGPAGVGKTTLAILVSKIFQSLQILCFGKIKIVTRAELVAAYLGQTAGLTRAALFSSLEGVLFIDEAYQLGGCPKEDTYGMESLTEIVNFLDKYIGISVVIVAGYEKEMEECFFKRNEGLKRRFPNQFNLLPYGPPELLKILLIAIFKNLQADLFNRDMTEVVFIYKAIQLFHANNMFPNMGGDMQILAGLILRHWLATGNLHASIVSAFYVYCSRYGTGEQCNDLLTQLTSEVVGVV